MDIGFRRRPDKKSDRDCGRWMSIASVAEISGTICVL